MHVSFDWTFYALWRPNCMLPGRMSVFIHRLEEREIGECEFPKAGLMDG